ncbi:uncharacterized protein PITG_22570 [Phytophthora infestans T30-4]|uniref:Uncharacterized protein n=1 Tax=Phytophthora infestans (strain T30-4) TaxID=403677 RepID=D0RMJ1_PHYIT|nr:uncharacterized protein PITG_22570 [Phytophthora infestans T30-4]EEY64418.1 conserved hypothetical protein [Phytophthora infestans T30-4]|eukprot:XP_002909739.1 conserved hypothetical protein [Phytophthora infestans T30-4]
MKSLKKQLRLAEEARDDAQVHSNELRETLLSSESRCKRLQRELELLEHVSYFSQAITDDCDAEDPAMPSPLGIKRRRSFLAANAVPYSPFPRSVVAEDGEQVTVSKSELETHKKLHHYFHLTALSIINENNLHERCFSSSSRLTIDMWYREISAKEVPFLMWHSWLINRISEVAASVQDEDKMPQPPTSSSKHPSFGGAFHGFSLRKKSDSGENGAQNALPSPPTASPGASPVARVPFTVARAFFRLLRKRTHAGADSSQVNGSPVSGSPAG